MKRSVSLNRVILVLCAVVFGLATLVAQIALLKGLPTLAASLPTDSLQQAWDRAHTALARLASAVESTDLGAPSEQAHAQVPSFHVESSPERAV